MNGPGAIHAQVCVVGAGPAGAALAARLARLGHDVALVEREAVPRSRVGESLGPGSWPLLDALGLREAVAAAGFVRSAQARIRWRTTSEESPVEYAGLTVDRGAFDSILLANARAAGATVITSTRAGRPRRVGDGWEVPLDGRVVHSRFLADATGRRRLLGGPRTAVSPRTLALYAAWAGAEPVDRPQSRVDVLADAWLWGAHLPGGGFRAMAFVDPAAVAGAGPDRGRLYRRLLGASPMFAELLTDARPLGPVQVCDATSYLAAEPVDGSLVKVGEAAFAIDPLSSSGVQVAGQTALAAGAVVHTLLTPEGDTRAAMRYYTDLVAHTVTRHAATATALYAEHETYANTAFWRRRSAGAQRATPAGLPAPVRLSDLLAQPVRLVADATLEPVPCLVGERIEARRALTCSALDRPVAFLAGTELAPLLEVLPVAPSLAGAVAIWDRKLSAGRGHEIAAWLARRGLLRPLGQPPVLAADSHPTVTRADR